jgi:hypothetical protein
MVIKVSTGIYYGVIMVSHINFKLTTAKKTLMTVIVILYINQQYAHFLSVLFLVGLWFELGFYFAKQVLYCLSHDFSPFCCVYFGDGPHKLFVWAGLEP